MQSSDCDKTSRSDFSGIFKTTSIKSIEEFLSLSQQTLKHKLLMVSISLNKELATWSRNEQSSPTIAPHLLTDANRPKNNIKLKIHRESVKS